MLSTGGWVYKKFKRNTAVSIRKSLKEIMTMILKIQTVLPQAVSKSGRGSCKASICLFLVRPRMFYIWGSIESSQYRSNLFIFLLISFGDENGFLAPRGTELFFGVNYIDGISRQSHFWTRTPVAVWLWKHQRLGSPITPASEAFPLPAPCVPLSCYPLLRPPGLQPTGLLSMGFSRQEYWEGAAISFSRGSSRPRD